MRPFDNFGRFVSLKCPNPDCDGTLIREGDRWQCDGLVDPNNPNVELQACRHTHRDGDPVE